ncbi:NADH-ubiquinone oxidoreductase-F iron-sulfur binding region domain-containing protein [Ornithinimicrobium panacihumi]|uniref:NADH-ubiquinone oxidoreductase-F iron-sulfur binding region domain-containing protein n=1 Tax=Ornithinimicrobium panacihumi TaxID=2008449 RepID=UPI003F8A16D1
MRIVWVPKDSSARAMGADEVAAALGAVDGVTVRRNGSRGMLWREPLVEVETDRGRVGYANVAADQVEDLVEGGLLDGAEVGDRIGVIDEDPWLTGQQRITCARIGRAEPTDIAAYEAGGGWAGLRRALELTGAEVVQEVIDSGLRGRGGAGFPTGIKWRTVLQAQAPQKYVACNLDEGDSGTFADRILAEADPFTLVEGMAIAGLAVGATEGYIYCRSEYPDVIAVLRDAIAVAGEHGYLGDDVAGSGRAFRLWVRTGAGAYICGEETSMLESIEGRRGEVRAKPPIPALEGLWGSPTIVNNMVTFGAVPMILADGGEAYAALGTGRSRGTQLFQLAGNIRRGGLVELPFGVTLRELVEEWGGGTLTGAPVRAVQCGGPLGQYLPVDRLDVKMGYEELAEAGGMLGHGGVVVFDDTFDAARMARFAMEFCSIESCGKCTPCRIGSTRGVETIDRLCATTEPGERTVHLATLQDLCDTMVKGSLCAMGGLTPMPVRSALEHFPEDFERSSR